MYFEKDYLCASVTSWPSLALMQKNYFAWIVLCKVNIIFASENIVDTGRQVNIMHRLADRQNEGSTDWNIGFNVN